MMIKTTFTLFATLTLSTTLWATNVAPLEAMVKRVAPDLEGRVTFDVNPSAQAITLTPTSETNFTITAPNLSQAAAGVGCYLRSVAKAHWSWCGSRTKGPMPTPTQTLTFTPAFDHHIAYNFCTLSYTMAYWDEGQWTEELDRLSLYGFDMPLVQVGLQKVWQLTLREIGYPEEKIAQFLPDEASAAWWNMGNLEGLGGPLTQAEIDRNARLGRWLVQEMKCRGMRPILLGFTGLVPHDLGTYLNAQRFGAAQMIQQGHWVDGFQRPAVLSPTSEAFSKIAAIYYKHLKAVYGVQSIDAFAGDLFHEGGSSSGLDVTTCARIVQAEQQKASPGALWIVQAWHGNPTPALLAGLNPKLTIVEALVGDHANGHTYHRDFSGIPWVWCELLNFGGNHGLYGGFHMLTQMGHLTRQPTFKTMVGFGLLSEGLETNPLFYELFTERFFMPAAKDLSATEADAWLADYALRRYGVAPVELITALKRLTTSVYHPTRAQEGSLESIYCAKPSWTAAKASSWASATVYYNAVDTLKAAQLFHAVAKANPALLNEATFRYDYVDVVRQALSDCGRPLLAEARTSKAARQDFLKMILSTDIILEGSPSFRMDVRETAARSYGKNRAVRALRRMYTTWSGRSGKLNDYAHRQLSGLMRYYYYQRWKDFFDAADQNRSVSFVARDKAYLNRAIAKVEAPTNAALLKRVDLVLDFVEKTHHQYPERFRPTTGVPWALPKTSDATATSTMRYTVTKHMRGAERYAVEVIWTHGPDTLNIEKVELYEDGVCVAVDAHKGSTGIKHVSSNIYVLDLPRFHPEKTYELVLTGYGEAGSNSHGYLTLAPVNALHQRVQMNWSLPKPSPVHTMTFSVSEYITAAGRYDVTITCLTGPQALKIEKVELYEGSKLVAVDAHKGSTGIKQHVDNVYTLDVKHFRTGLDDYELRITGFGDGGQNASGIFTITPKK